MAALLLTSPPTFLPPILSSKKSPINSFSPATKSSPSPSSSCSRILSPLFASTTTPSVHALRCRVRYRVGSWRCGALGEGSERAFNDEKTVYSGVYGPWTVEPSDVREVILYRCGLVTAAASFVLASSAAFLPEGNALGDILKQDIDFLYLLGASGLGLSLFLIHIYVTPIKRFLQALWAVGVAGSIATYLNLARPLEESLIQYVIDNPIAIWFVGPLFAALTGLVFKEGLCYGKLEAGILTFIIPGLLLGHLTGLMDNGTKLSLLGIWMALFVVFAARKFQQPIKDDIGDKSVFMFNALPEEEKKALVQKLEQQSYQELD
ncbi:uncharacterized protein A4U43_C10F3680 [Asparagus officinalis]|uniref:Integral membrane protein n=1 Tax=Asparagus officinalis TaxID=4686 RepID=A0A5P1E3N2_ASPOF|nr:uncharacterized protein LOC109825625 [Asparagus officinalis]ONK56055.1 uncharacterized protein A4U43_C10F3680 [Asparagus officinalis]